MSAALTKIHFMGGLVFGASLTKICFIGGWPKTTDVVTGKYLDATPAARLSSDG
jgi:hypothetical protein